MYDENNSKRGERQGKDEGRGRQRREQDARALSPSRGGPRGARLALAALWHWQSGWERHHFQIWHSHRPSTQVHREFSVGLATSGLNDTPGSTGKRGPARTG